MLTKEVCLFRWPVDKIFHNLLIFPDESPTSATGKKTIFRMGYVYPEYNDAYVCLQRNKEKGCISATMITEG